MERAVQEIRLQNIFNWAWGMGHWALGIGHGALVLYPHKSLMTNKRRVQLSLKPNPPPLPYKGRGA